ncbi:unnamed protein product [Diplocarpon coronariae]|nr:hypothetical protein JHW43_001950 [Diplocarpon mali]
MVRLPRLAVAVLAVAVLAAPPSILQGRSVPGLPSIQSGRTVPGVPSIQIAEKLLYDIDVAPHGPQKGYSRELFPHWISLPGKCNTRKLVLQRDGSNAITGDACAILSGTWYSPYDGKTWSNASDVDIDHMVPLSNAWKSGAAAWTTDQRRDFANDLSNPQLWVVTDEVNRRKSDRGPELWMPPLESYHCTYARAWIKVKSVYNLSVTKEERDALYSMLDTCYS